MPAGGSHVSSVSRWSSRRLTIAPVLLVGAGLRSSQQVWFVDPGFGCEPTVILTFPATVHPRCGRRGACLHAAGVEAVGAFRNLHLNPLSRSLSDFNVDELQSRGMHFELGVDAQRRESPVAGGTDTALLGRASVRS